MKVRIWQIVVLILLVPLAVALWQLKDKWWLELALIPVILVGLHGFLNQSALWKWMTTAFLLVTVVVYSGYIFNTMRENVETPAEWDIDWFWLAGRIGAQRLNIYDPQNYLREIEKTGLTTSEGFREVIGAGAFSYPPPTIFWFVPLGWFSLQTSLIIWYVFQSIVLVLVIYRLYQIFLKDYGFVGLLAAASFTLILDSTRITLSIAQTGLLLLFFFLSYWREDNPIRAGIWLMLAILVKPVAAVIAIYLILQQKWRTLWGAFLTGLLLSVIFIAIYGLPMFLAYRVSPPQPNFVYTEEVNQSLLAVILRVTNYDLTLHSAISHPLFIILTSALVLISAWLIYRLPSSAAKWGISLALLLGLLIYPGTLNHYSVLLLPVLLLIWNSRTRLKWGTYAAITFITFEYAIIRYNYGSLITVGLVACWALLAVICFFQIYPTALQTFQAKSLSSKPVT